MAIRGRGALAALLLAGALGLAACAASAVGAGPTGTALGDRAAECDRNRGVWRPHIADGYCEIKP
jgi:hypothetical protein